MFRVCQIEMPGGVWPRATRALYRIADNTAGHFRINHLWTSYKMSGGEGWWSPLLQFIGPIIQSPPGILIWITYGHHMGFLGERADPVPWRQAGLHRTADSLPRNRMGAPDSPAQGPDSHSRMFYMMVISDWYKSGWLWCIALSNYSGQSLQEYHSGQSHGQNR